MLTNFFKKKKKYATVPDLNKKKDIPEGIVQKCPKCGNILFKKELEKNLKVCVSCSYHFPLTALERINLVIDKGTFVEVAKDLVSLNILNFPNYTEKLESDKQKTGLNEAVVVGKGKIGGFEVVIAVMDSFFRMGSMGSVVGEKITIAISKALEIKRPLIIFSASGGARMQEGVLSLMQMAKTTAALAKLAEEGILYISVFTNPTTGGVSASFSSLGDINIAEPGALIGFAGKRVVEQTVKQKIPEDFQTSEFLLKNGQLDKIVPRYNMKDFLIKILSIHERR